MRSSSMNELLPQQSMKAAGSFQGDELPDPSAITQIKRSSINRSPLQKVDKKNPVKAKEEPEGEAKVTLDEKRAKTNAKPQGRPGENVDVKARKGQASDIRGLPEILSTNRPVERRIRRRPKTSEQKKSQQDLVPGSNKVNGKAKMLDDKIINHKESLQVQIGKQDAKNPVKAEEEPEGDAKNAVDKAQAKTNSKTPEPTKDFIHLNGARRRNIRAQRIQGEKNGERMKFLPDPEPSSDKEMQKEDIKGLVESKEELKGDAKVTLDKKQAQTNTNFPVHPKENFDVRAGRGQASDIRNQAERVRRAKIGKRMKFLQDLVPGCNKVSGKAEVLDEIIKYIQLLHLQVELAKKDNKKEPLLGLTESQNSHYIDIEEANSVTDHKAQNKNDIDFEMLGSSETEQSNNIDIEKADDIGDHEAKNRSTGGCGKVDLEWILLITNFVLEFPSIVFDELSSVHKPLYALFAMLISLTAITICMVEFVRKAQKERVIWKWKGTLPWLHYPSESHKPFGTFKDIIGLVCAFGQCIVTSINYAFCLQEVDNPIKFSVWPTFFAVGLLCSKYFGDPEKRAIV